ncbi:putative porin [Ampullimonas aquatilis]|uniref:putative porin n=1 Tax=Ampullimonas aquatilis TaxID=1341549 RepID=UPI003C70FA57
MMNNITMNKIQFINMKSVIKGCFFRWIGMSGFFMTVFTICIPAFADQQSGDQGRELAMALVNALVEQGLLSREKAGELMQQAQARALLQNKKSEQLIDPLSLKIAPATSIPSVPSAHVQYVPEIVKQQLREDIRNEVIAQAHREGWATPGAVPEWVDHFSWEGDMRLRFQGEQFGKNNSTNIKNYQAINLAGTEAINNPFLYTDGAENVSPERDRLMLRARLGTSINVTKDVDIKLRLSTSINTDPISSNQTLGSYGGRYQMQLDRAWMHWRVNDHVDFWGGRIANPFLSTELIWAPDLGFDGVAMRYQKSLSNTVAPYALVGLFPLQELANSNHDKWLFGAQVGSEWTHGDSHLRWGLAWYGYQNVTGMRNDTDLHINDNSAPTYLQKGNTLYNIRVSSTDPASALYALAGNYRLLDMTATADVPVQGGKYVFLSADWVRNIGWNTDAVKARSGFNVDSQTTGYFLKLGLGDLQPSKQGDWQLFGSYRYLGADAVLDAFTDTEFHLGGTNAKGYILGGTYAVKDNSLLTLRWLSSDEITGPPLAIDILQVDMNLKF